MKKFFRPNYIPKVIKIKEDRVLDESFNHMSTQCVSKHFVFNSKVREHYVSISHDRHHKTRKMEELTMMTLHGRYKLFICYSSSIMMVGGMKDERTEITFDSLLED